MYERMPKVSLSKLIRDHVEKGDATHNLFRRFTQLLQTAVERQTALARSYRIAFWWEITFPVAFFVAMAIASLDQVRFASVSSWHQLISGS